MQKDRKNKANTKMQLSSKNGQNPKKSNGNNRADKRKTKSNTVGSSKDAVKGIDWDLYDRMYGAKSKAYDEYQNKGSKYVEKQGRGQVVGSKYVEKQGRGQLAGSKYVEKQGRGQVVGSKYVDNLDRDQVGNGRLKHISVIGNKGACKTASGENICPLNQQCGGCQYQGIDYKVQLQEKQKYVSSLLSKYGHVEPIIGMENPYHYRNKVHAVFDRDRYGNYISGIYKEGTHEVVHVEECLIEDQRADAIINSIRGLLKSFKIRTYDEDTGYGLLRHVLIRTGYHTNEIMVVLVLGSPILPSKNNFVKALRQLHPEISTIIINVNNKQTSMVLGDKQTTIYGKGYIEDILCGCRFRISPKSFYQVNPVQTEVLYNTAIKLAGLDGTQTVIDAYCGIGTIGIIASKYAKEVISVELNSDAVKDANVNAKINNIENITFYNNDASVFMEEMAAEGNSVDLVIMDPPRAGSTETFIDAIHKLKAKKVVYVSCNPETLARDLEYFKKKGYRAKHIVPVDMFAFTDHVETVVALHRTNM